MPMYSWACRMAMETQKIDIHRKRCRRENVTGHAHFLTFSCFHRRPYLSRDRTRQWLLDAIASAIELHRFDLWAYVIMPEHVHLVVFPREEEYSISGLLSSIKLPVTKKAINFVRREAPRFISQMEDRQPGGQTSMRFWQRGGGYDRNLYSPDEVWQKIEYIHNNPVKRGMVGVATDYQWSSAADYQGTRNGPLKINPEFLPR
jgi:putative transposase